MSNLQTSHHLSTISKQCTNKQDASGLFVHGTKRRKDNQLHSLALACKLS